MSEETQQRIQQIIDETGYEPSAAARAMKAKSSGLIGVILKDAADPYCARALKGMGEAAGETEYQILIGSSGYTFKIIGLGLQIDNGLALFFQFASQHSKPGMSPARRPEP